MTFTPIIPTSWDPTRQTVNDFLDAIVTGFQAQYPSVVRKFWSEIPATYAGEVPLVYLGDLTEAIVHDAGLRVTTYTGSIGYVDVSPDNQEANTRANAFADYFREVFTANARIYPPGIFQQTGLSEGRASDGPMQGFMHLIVAYQFVIQEGRN